METRKKMRKAFPYNRKILEKFQKAQCKELSIEITPLDNSIMAMAKALSDSEVARILEGNESDTDTSKSHNALSPRTENRLRRKENGMVLLPRSFYNEHPAKKVIQGLRPTRSSGSRGRNDNSSRKREATPAKGSRNETPSKRVKDGSSSHVHSVITQKENQPLGRGLRNKTPKENKLKSGKPSFKKIPNPKQKTKPNGLNSGNNNNYEKEYHLVFIDPINVNCKDTNNEVNLLSLSDLLNTDQLPSKIWEVERVPPLLVNTKSDVTYNTIAAELDALMADDEQDEHGNEDTASLETNMLKPEDDCENIKTLPEDKMNKDTPEIPDQIHTSDKDIKSSEDTNNIEESALDTKQNNDKKDENSPETNMEDIAIIEPDTKDEYLNKIESPTKNEEAVLEKEQSDILENKDTLVSEEVSKEKKKTEIGDEEEWKERDDNEVNKKITEGKDEAENTQTTKEKEPHQNITEKSDCAPEKDETVPQKTESEISSENETVKAEEFPSIMDLLNENAASESEGKEPNDSSKIVADSQEKPEDESLTKVVSEVNAASNSTNNISDKVLDKETPKESTQKKGDSNEKITTAPDKSNTSSRIPENVDETITSVVFRRFSSDNQTYDRLVIFQSDLKYTVKINNKEVELLGAPKHMTSTEDLQILLQIVDEVSLDSFNVICKN